MSWATDLILILLIASTVMWAVTEPQTALNTAGGILKAGYQLCKTTVQTVIKITQYTANEVIRNETATPG
jgi:hypothetical protein